jgi:non-ribosomal peptide synthetase component E (peptide arylation enzyme)
VNGSTLRVDVSSGDRRYGHARCGSARLPTILPELLERHLSRAPDATALLAPSRASLSYALLNRQIRGRSAPLRAAATGQHDIVAIALPIGAELAAAITEGYGMTEAAH